MMKKLAIITIASLCITLVSCGGAEPKDDNSVSSKGKMSSVFSEKNGEDETNKKGIDLNALKAVEDADTFNVSVISIEKFKDGYKGGAVLSLVGDDAILVKIKNNTGAKIQNFKVLVLATDKNGNGCDLGKLQSMPKTIITNEHKVEKYSNYVKCLENNTADLAVGAEKEYGVRCNLQKIENVNAIVYSYVDATGKEVVNNNYEKWLEKTIK